VASVANAYPICDVASIANAYPICDVASVAKKCGVATVANVYPICDVAGWLGWLAGLAGQAGPRPGNEIWEVLLGWPKIDPEPLTRSPDGTR